MDVTKAMPLIFGLPREDFYKTLKVKQVFVAELRPGLEGMKTVSAECLKAHITPVVICDNMMAWCMKRGLVSGVHLFYSKCNPKSCLCRCGSLIAALAAQAHGIKVFLHPGSVIRPRELPLHKIDGCRVTSEDIKTYAPVFEEVALSLVSKIYHAEDKKWTTVKKRSFRSAGGSGKRICQAPPRGI